MAIAYTPGHRHVGDAYASSTTSINLDFLKELEKQMDELHRRNIISRMREAVKLKRSRDDR